MTRIVRLEARDFKRLRAVEITPEGAVVEIRGKNGAGKSSILDAIEAAMAGGKLPTRPIRDGAENASIVTELDNGLVVTRKFLASGNSTLTVANAEGARFQSPQTVLDKLTGAIAFDPLEFTRVKPGARLETLRGLVTLDIDPEAIEAERGAAYEQRTQVNREAATLRKQAEGIVIPDDLPDAPVDVAALTAEVARAGEHNAAIERERSRRAALEVQAQGCAGDEARLQTEITAVRERLAALLAELGKVRSDGVVARSLLASLPALSAPIDTAAVAAKITEAHATNTMIRGRVQRRDLETRAAELEGESQKLTDKIADCDRQKVEAVERATFPVAGLGFGDGDVTFNGIPFEQSSQAEKIRVSVAIAMSMNPTLKVLCVRDGSLLDRDSMRALAEQVGDAGYQLWVEAVGEGSGAGVVIEDGLVADQLAPVADWGSAEVGEPIEPTIIPGRAA